MRNRLLYVALRAGFAVAPRVPFRIAYTAASLAGWIAYLALAGPRGAVRANVARALGISPDSAQARRVARRVFQSNARNWLDTLRIHQLSDAEVLASVEVDHWERVKHSLDGGGGVIMLGMHLGNIDLVGQVISARGCRLTIPVERLEPPELFDFIMERRRTRGIVPVVLDRAPREMVRALRRGEIAAVICDRVVSGHSVGVELLGGSMEFPQSPAALARMTGAPVHLGIGVRSAPGRYLGFVSEQLPFVRTDDAESDARHNMQLVADEVAKFLRRFPDQWVLLGPAWRERTAEIHAATIGHSFEAAR